MEEKIPNAIENYYFLHYILGANSLFGKMILVQCSKEFLICKENECYPNL